MYPSKHGATDEHKFLLPGAYRRLYLPEGIPDDRARRFQADVPAYLAGETSMDAEDFALMTALYDAEITYLDARLGELFADLDRLGLLDSTMIIVTADHGENLGEHGLIGHAFSLYDTLVHVPLIIRYPAGTTSPGSVAEQVQTLDIPPTVLALLGEDGSPPYQAMQGKNLLDSTQRREFTVAEQRRPDLSVYRHRFPRADMSRFDRTLQMIRTEQYKLIWASDGRHELYDLQADPGERRNLITERPEIASRLMARLSAWRDRFTPVDTAGTAPEFDEAVKERLRALGYIE